MTFIEGLAYIGTAATILGVFLTIYAIINNKTLKSESKLTREMIQQTSQYISNLIEEIRKDTKETTQYLGNLTKESTQYLGDLIVAEGNKIRRDMG
ncbi:MAG: hypothetical protein AB1567_02675 [bacterium]